MLSCKDIAHNTSHYVDPALPWHRKLGWYLHLSMCNNCRKFVKQFHTTLAYLHRLPRKEAEPQQVEKVLAALPPQKKSPDP